MVKRILTVLLLISVLIPCVSYADYYFTVERQETHLWINKDGSVEIWYYIHFYNQPSGQMIDIVDIGLPFKNYDLSTARATIDGKELPTVRKSEYIQTGVEIPLTGHVIFSGKRGVVSLKIVQPGMVFQDDVDENYASVEFYTNFFGDEFTTGKSLIEVYFHFPSGVKPEEPRYHQVEFTKAGVDEKERVYYYWQIKDGDIALAYRFGASFPKAYMDEGAVKKVTFLDKVFLFFANIFRGLIPEPLIFPCLIPWGIIIGFVVVGILNSKRRKMQYLKPSISARGVGIKRGLTAVEAAILLEKKFDRIFAMIVFGLIKKGYMRVKQDKKGEFEKIKVQDPTYHAYESKFLESIEVNGKPDQTILKKLAIDLVKNVETKMKGFNLRMTKNYYEGIVETAWKHVKSADLENSVEWTMLDDDFEKMLPDINPTGGAYRSPTWWPHYYDGYYYGGGHTTSGGGGVPSPGKATLSPKQFANTVATSFESTSHNVVSKVESFTSGVTAVTNPIPQSSSSWSSGSSGGGSSCACACACAGCACACAGGGR